MTNIKLKDLSMRDRMKIRIAAFVSHCIEPINIAVSDTMENTVLNYVRKHDIQRPWKMTYGNITVSLGEETEKSS